MGSERRDGRSTPATVPGDISGAAPASQPKWLRLRLGNPRHRATTTFLIVSVFLMGNLWLIDVCCMSLYWVARLPRLRGGAGAGR
jgi:hypothetical protein